MCSYRSGARSQNLVGSGTRGSIESSKRLCHPSLPLSYCILTYIHSRMFIFLRSISSNPVWIYCLVLTKTKPTVESTYCQLENSSALWLTRAKKHVGGAKVKVIQTLPAEDRANQHRLDIFLFFLNPHPLSFLVVQFINSNPDRSSPARSPMPLSLSTVSMPHL